MMLMFMNVYKLLILVLEFVEFNLFVLVLVIVPFASLLVLRSLSLVSQTIA